MTAAVTLSSKYQVVIPKEARDALHLKAGKKLLVHVEGDKYFNINNYGNQLCNTP